MLRARGKNIMPGRKCFGQMNIIRKWEKTIQKHWFLFTELTKRDFKLKYKGTVLGMFWSMLSPLLQLLVMRVVFTEFFGRDTPFYSTYLFSGLIVFNYYSEATKGSIKALSANRGIILKIRVPKYLFLLSKNISSLINFLIIIPIYLVFSAIDGVHFDWCYFGLLYPILLLPLFCIGVGLILSAMEVFFNDTKYLYDIFVILLRYLSAIFYNIDRFSEGVQRYFLINPVYAFIKYFRLIVIENRFPSLGYHALLLGYTVAALLIGGLIYKKNNRKFAFYL